MIRRRKNSACVSSKSSGIKLRKRRREQSKELIKGKQKAGMLVQIGPDMDVAVYIITPTEFREVDDAKELYAYDQAILRCVMDSPIDVIILGVRSVNIAWEKYDIIGVHNIPIVSSDGVFSFRPNFAVSTEYKINKRTGKAHSHKLLEAGYNPDSFK